MKKSSIRDWNNSIFFLLFIYGNKRNYLMKCNLKQIFCRSLFIEIIFINLQIFCNDKNDLKIIYKKIEI